MKVNYKGLATSAALALAVLIGASDITSAQGRRGRGEERRQEGQAKPADQPTPEQANQDRGARRWAPRS